MLYQKCEQYGKALATLNKYRELRPEDAATVDCRIGFLYEDSGKWAEGLRVVEGWATQRPNDACLQYAWARLLEKKGLSEVQAEKFKDATASYRLAEAKLTPIVADQQYGESASAQLKRLDQLIRIAEGKRKQVESEE
jgi:tetratricopeptide (TPR) repeat protein